jgi:ubiquinone/menaquinone biosynthesis C-methylase UbiE
MADGRDVACWTNHAREQLEQHPEPHDVDKKGIILQWFQERKDKIKRVLDLGCGTGLWRNLFKDFQYIGADQNAAMIQGAIQRGVDENESFIQVGWDRLPFEDNVFDAVFTSAVLQHNSHAHKRRVIKEIVRVIRPGGFYVGTENTFREDNYHTTFPRVPNWHAALDDGYSLTPEGWKLFMEPQGFKLLIYQPPGYYLYQVL